MPMSLTFHDRYPKRKFCNCKGHVIVLRQFDFQPRFHVSNFGTCADLESKAKPSLDPYQKLFVTYTVFSGYHAKFHAFITKVNNSAGFFGR